MRTRSRSAGFQPAQSAVPQGGAAPQAAKKAALPAELAIRNRGHLPHWEREYGTYFVTFRLADSLPKPILESYVTERQKILQVAEQQGRELTRLERIRVSELFSKRIDSHLDSGTGACPLAKPAIAETVAEALHRFDGERYRLLAWCVMPNHVHIVFEMMPGESLAKVIHSWKSFTANRANSVLGSTGQFWQREYYDHLVRDEEDLGRVIRYVAENPSRAKLKRWPWVWTWGAGLQPAP